MKRRAVLGAILASGLAAGCASSSFGAGGGAMFAECYDEDCVGYDEYCRADAYLRTPSTPADSRAEVRLSDAGRPAPRTVDRSTGTTGVMRSTAVPRSAPAPSRPPTTTASRP